MGVNIFLADKKPNKKLVFKIAKDYNLHTADLTHVAIAYENKAEFIVTWNKKDFGKANKFVKCKSPMEILDIL